MRLTRLPLPQAKSWSSPLSYTTRKAAYWLMKMIASAMWSSQTDKSLLTAQWWIMENRSPRRANAYLINSISGKFRIPALRWDSSSPNCSFSVTRLKSSRRRSPSISSHVNVMKERVMVALSLASLVMLARSFTNHKMSQVRVNLVSKLRPAMDLIQQLPCLSIGDLQRWVKTTSSVSTQTLALEEMILLLLVHARKAMMESYAQTVSVDTAVVIASNAMSARARRLTSSLAASSSSFAWPILSFL